MKQRPRIYYTESQKKLMWDHWQKGDSLQHIAQLFDRNHSSIQRILAETGGIRPAVRRRSRLALTLAEREEISRAVVAGNSIRSMAALLGEQPRPLAVRSDATVVKDATGLLKLIRLPGIARIGLRSASLLRTERWRKLLQTSFNCSGHRNKLPAG